jgi:hypothetical protein
MACSGGGENVRKELKIAEIQEFEPIDKTDTTRVRVRLVRYNEEKEPRLDVRTFVETARFTGWTTKGVALPVGQYRALKALIPLIDQGLRELGIEA